MTTQEVARLFGVSSRTVRNWCDDNLLPSYRLPYGRSHRRVREVDVLLFSEKHNLPTDGIKRRWQKGPRSITVMAIDVGTIGRLRCEINLNKILMELGDKNITRFVTKTLVDFRMGLRQLLNIHSKSWQLTFMNSWYNNCLNKVEAKKLPLVVHSHMLCCMKAYWRNIKHEHLPHEANSVELP